MKNFIHTLDAAREILCDADHFDAKTVEGAVSLRQFLAGFMAYQPGWITALYGVRAGFVRLLGMRQEGMPQPLKLRPEAVPFEPGKAASFFRVVNAREDEYWIAAATDSHLTAYVIIAVEPLNGPHRRFHIGTVVRYHNWAGPVYFNVIRPFHHLVVRAMARAGVQPPVGPQRAAPAQQ